MYDILSDPNIGVGGTIVTVPIDAEHREKKIDRIMVTLEAGDATLFDVIASTHSAVTDKNKVILESEDDSPSAPADYDNGGQGFTWEPSASVYVKCTPNTGSNNRFRVRLFFFPEG